jgi:putative chromate ion transporter
METEDSEQEGPSVVLELPKPFPSRTTPRRTDSYCSYWEILQAYIPLSLTSFGGPSAHVSMFLDKFVTQDKWITEKVFTELFAISQSLPGPASTQLGYSIALLRAGILPGLLSFLCWSLPGMFVMIGFAYGINEIGNSLPIWLQYVSNGLTSAALGLVALAAFKLSTKLLVSPVLVIIGVTSASLAVNFPTVPWLYPVMIAGGGLATFFQSYIAHFRESRTRVENLTTVEEVVEVDAVTVQDADSDNLENNMNTSLKVGLIVLGLWLILLISSILFKTIAAVPLALRVFGNLYFAGSIIFGGGPVVIALLQSWFVDDNMWMTNREFLLGLALINSMPGPNFNLGAFCGALAMRSSPASMWAGGLIGWAGIFSPGLLLMTGLIPLWRKYRSLKYVDPVFVGINASAVGLIIAAVYILARKAIVIPSSVSVGDADQLTKYPLYTSVAAIAYALAGFTSLPAPFAILIGGLVGLFHWISIS